MNKMAMRNIMAVVVEKLKSNRKSAQKNL